MHMLEFNQNIKAEGNVPYAYRVNTLYSASLQGNTHLKEAETLNLLKKNLFF